MKIIPFLRDEGVYTMQRPASVAVICFFILSSLYNAFGNE